MVKVKQVKREEVTVELAKEMCGLGLCQYCPMLGCPVDDDPRPTHRREPEMRRVEVDWLGDSFVSRVKNLINTAGVKEKRKTLT